MIADELVTVLGVDIKGSALNNIKSMEAGLNKLASTAKTASIVVAGLATSFMLMVGSVTAEAQELQKTADKTGVTVEQLQELDYIAAKTGADAKALRNDIVSLTKSMSSPIPGQFNMNMLMFGISAYKANGQLKTSAELLGDIAGKLEGMSPQRQLQWASRVGISDETLIALKEGKAGIQALAEEANRLGLIIPAESIKRAADFRKEISTLRLYLDRLKQSIVIGALPVLERFVSRFKEFINLYSGRIANSLHDFTEGFIIAWDTLQKALRPLERVFSSLKRVIEDFLGPADKVELWAHLLYQGMLGIIVLFSPFIAKWVAIAAAAKVVLLILEDVVGYLTGTQETLTGGIVDYIAKEFPGLVELLKKFGAAAISAFEWLYENVAKVGASAYWTTIKTALTELSKLFKDVTSSVNKWVSEFDTRFPHITRLLSNFRNTAASVFKEVGGFIETYIKVPVDLVVSALETLINLIGKAINTALSGVDAASGLLDKGLSGAAEVTSDLWGGFKGWMSENSEEFAKAAKDWSSRFFGWLGTTGVAGAAFDAAGTEYSSPLTKGATMSNFLGLSFMRSMLRGSETRIENTIYVTTGSPQETAVLLGGALKDANVMRTGILPGYVTPTVR